MAFPHAATAGSAGPPDTIAARTDACAPCHGAQGQGTADVYFPRAAGNPSGYLYNRLVAFKYGRRRYPPMNYLLQYNVRHPLPSPATTQHDGNHLCHTTLDD